MNKTACHLVGVYVLIEGRLIQRCCICGKKLIDCIEEVKKCKNDEDINKLVFPPNGLVREKNGRFKVISQLKKNIENNLPQDLCIDLVEQEYCIE